MRSRSCPDAPARRWGLASAQSPAQRWRADLGMVTAETAVVLPALAVVLAVLLAVMGYALDQASAVDAARTGARLAARGEPVGVVREAVLAEAPKASHVTVRVSASNVTVTVSAPPRRLLGVVSMPSVRAEAVSLAEGVDLP